MGVSPADGTKYFDIGFLVETIWTRFFKLGMIITYVERHIFIPVSVTLTWVDAEIKALPPRPLKSTISTTFFLTFHSYLCTYFLSSKYIMQLQKTDSLFSASS